MILGLYLLALEDFYKNLDIGSGWLPAVLVGVGSGVGGRGSSGCWWSGVGARWF